VHRYNEWVILAAVVLHVIAIATYHWGLRVNLVGPMVHGKMVIPAAVPPPRVAASWVAAVLFAIACGTVYWLVAIYPRAPA
jgi:hypothetical protein